MAVTLSLVAAPFAQAATFSDVQTASPHYDAISKISDLGIIKGGTDGKFKPDALVTRAEAWRALLLGLSESLSQNGTKSMRFLQGPSEGGYRYNRNSLMSETSNTNENWFQKEKNSNRSNTNGVKSQQGITRGELADFIYRLINLNDTIVEDNVPAATNGSTTNETTSPTVTSPDNSTTNTSPAVTTPDTTTVTSPVTTPETSPEPIRVTSPESPVNTTTDTSTDTSETTTETSPATVTTEQTSPESPVTTTTETSTDTTLETTTDDTSTDTSTQTQ